MQIDSLIIDASVTDILTTLKAQLANEHIHLFAKTFDSGKDVMICCPYHKDGQERKPSAGIRKSDGLMHCLACGKTVRIDEMIANCFGHSDSIWGYKWLAKNFVSINVEDRDEVELDFGRNTSSKSGSTVYDTFITDEELDSYRYVHPYMYERGLTDDVIDLFDIGYDKQTNSITFPVRDKSGVCRFVAKRSVSTKRFDLPKNIAKPLYGLYETCKLGKIDTVYVCEGLFDCLRLWCVGKVAVAGFGCLFSDYQIKLLEELPTRKITLALDNDAAGYEAAEYLRQRIRNKIVTEVVLPDNRKDIGECTDEELHNLKEIY